MDRTPRVSFRPWPGGAALAVGLLLVVAGGLRAGLQIRSFDAPPITDPARFSVDFETGNFLISPSFALLAEADLFIDTSTGGNPGYADSLISGSTFSFLRNATNVVLVESGVLIDGNLTSLIPGTSFNSYGYFAPVAPGTRYLALQTSADLDQNPATTGIHFGFLQLDIGSMDVVGYGFGGLPGEAVTTAPIPEPAVFALAWVGAALALRRRRP